MFKKLIYEGRLYGDPFLTKAFYGKKFYVLIYFLNKYRTHIVFTLFFLLILISLSLKAYVVGKIEEEEIIISLKEDKKILKDHIIENESIIDSFETLKSHKNYKRFLIFNASQYDMPLHLTHEELNDILYCSKRYKIPMNLLIRIIKAESSFKRASLSSKNASGLMQLMPSTEKRCEGATNIQKGCYWLNKLQKKNKNWEKTLREYNSGNPEGTSGETNKYIKRIL